MGIYFNHKLLSPNPDGSEIEKKYHKEQEELRALFAQFGGKIMLKRDGNPIWDITRTSFRPFVPFALPVEVYIDLPSLGRVGVRYSETAPILVDKNYVYTGNRLLIYDRIQVKDTQIDLAWYLIKACDFVEVTDVEGNLLTERGGNRFLKIDNPIVEVKAKASENKKIASLDRYIYLDDSPIYNIDAANHLARQFGIEIDARTVDMAMHQIRSAVLAGESTRNPNINIERFVTYVKQMGRREYDSEWDGVMPENGFNDLQLQTFNYGSLKQIAKGLDLDVGNSPKADFLRREIKNHFETVE